MNRNVCGVCWALYDDKGMCECLPESLPKPETVTIGPFCLQRYDQDSFWLGHESGEGMQVKNHRMLEVFNELWKEF